MKKTPQELIIKQFIDKHGDKYNYSKVIFKGIHTHVDIICNECGNTFQQTPAKHRSGQGCKPCGRKRAGLKRRNNSNEMFELAKKTHNNIYIYDEDSYQGFNKKVKITCPEGHIFHQSLEKHINRKQGCPKCQGLYRTNEELIEKFKTVHGEEYGYEKTALKKMNEDVVITCRKYGHGDFNMTPTKHLSGQGCPICRYIKISSHHRHSLEDFIKLANKNHPIGRFSYDESIYINNNTLMEIYCNQHNGYFWQKPAVHKKSGCSICSGVAKKDTKIFIAEATAKHGDKFNYVRTNYKGIFERVEIGCNECGKYFWQIAKDHLEGCGCKYCAGNVKKDTEMFKEQAIVVHGSKYNYTLSEYTGIFEKVIIICNQCGNVFPQTAKLHLDGCGCPKCPNTQSKKETEIADFIESLGFVVERDISLSKERQLRFDAVLEEQKLIFEYNGCYYHSTEWKDPNYHVEKRMFAESNGYTMLSIWEDDYLIKGNKIKNLIRRKLFKPELNIHARKTIVAISDKLDSANFHEDHHIHDFRLTSATEHYSLIHDNEIVAIASFDKKGILHRYTIKTGISINGGLSKLIAAYRKDFGNIDIITYCDRDYFTGDLYVKTGFVKVSMTKQLTYFKNNKRHRREKFMKHKLPLMFENVDLSKTEIQICAENKVFACFNSGTEKYVLKSNTN